MMKNEPCILQNKRTDYGKQIRKEKDNLLLEPVVIQKCGDRDKEGTYSIHTYSNCIPSNPMSDRGQLIVECNER